MAEALWTGVARAYAQSFAGLCAGAAPALMDGLPRHGRLLDVGCGTGNLVRLARSAGIDAIGVEPDPEMAALAGAVLGSSEDVVVAGLPDLPWADDGFAVVIAAFVLNHVDHPRDAARELARVAAPGGHVRATIWGRTPPPQAVMWSGLLDEVDAVRPPVPRLPADRDFDRSPDGLADLLSEAGLAVTAADTLAWQWRVAPDDLWAGLTSIGNFAVLWRAQSRDVQIRLREAYDAVRGPWRDGEDFVFDVECVSVEARVPRS
ncbi:class I SAM-dependent methyltransferase [Nocardioides zhouii]|uniref:Class I SAM-dependent methyltransferase n=1 Tax=Nocardioides zhouii TaxID=1168729 RepID=A0A4Q2SN56_9ACTN|nr:class I SAM-dependent methyltransferase [Nocardioides zhouii]RYC07176.1 class I SAM-dependent methyltransferase [Nocardioides zhouii]